MSEPIPTKIIIGGPIPRDLLDELAEAISAQGVSREWEGGVEAAEAKEDIEEAAAAKQTVEFSDSEANYGLLDSLTEFLQEHDIWYDLYNTGKYEYNADWTFFRGGDLVVCPSNQNDELLVAVADVEKVLDDKNLTPAKKVKALRTIVRPVDPLPHITITD